MGQRQAKPKPPVKKFRDGSESVPGKMSRSLSALTFGTRSRKHSEPASPDHNENIPALSQRQKCVIKESFTVVRDAIAEVGVVLFMRLFETHPEVQEVFLPFKGMSKEEMAHSKQLRTHGLRVMGFVEKCVSRIEQPEKIIALCLELGLKHVRFGAPVEYLDLIGPQFIYAVKPTFKNRWTPEVEEAWLAFFALAIYFMRQSMVPDMPPTAPRKGSV